MFVFTSILASCAQQQSAEQYIKNGLGHYASRNWQSAIIEFKNAIKQDPENSLARASLGKTYLKVSYFDAAVKELERAESLGYDLNQIII